MAESSLQNAESSLQNAEVEEPKVEIVIPPIVKKSEIASSLAMTEPKVSAFSISSIRAKRELQESTKGFVKEEVHLPTQAFTETEMLLQWSKYAQRLSDKGHKIMESLLLISDPKLEGTTITHELPNDGSKIEFETEKLELLGYLRGKLHNHDITIEVVVNEKVENKFAFTPIDKYNRLNEINPNLDLLKKTFDLDL
ncbi:MAG: hypothetical protein JHC39_05815 [Lentimicrobium sp.]|nr:hypothetical protein [Lentimicrobium sp.]